MKLLNFTIIKLTSCLIIGILLSHYLNITFSWVFKGISPLIIILCASFFYAKKQFKKTIWFGIATYITMISIGILVHNLHDQKHIENHYLHNDKIKKNRTVSVIFKVKKLLKPNMYYSKYMVEILSIDNKSTKGKLLLSIEKDSLVRNYNVDDILLTSTKLLDINPPLNPNQFDYKNYLEKQYIYCQLKSNTRSIYTINSQRHTIFGYAHALRIHINKNLQQHHLDPDVLAIINALILGKRNDLSNEVYDNYVNAGAIHILAVSGLHVGIILMILNIVFKPITYLKNGRLIKTLFILLLLWSFAFVAGLSASVTRAVTMFSIVAIAMHLKRSTNIYNTLAISILILLLFKPMFLFDVGFQMSYLAVIAIVSIQPVLYKLWHPKWFIINYLWQIFTVTIAAQFGVVPISLYYFHQFPGLFIVSNMILIPFLGIILGLGIIVIIMASLNKLPEIIASSYGSIISFMNKVIDWISKQEEFLFKDISFNMFHVLASYVLIVILFRFYNNKNYRYTRLFLITLLLIQITVIIHKLELPNQEFIIYNKSRSTVLGYKVESTLLISHDKDSITHNNLNFVKSYSIKNFIHSIETDSLKSVYTFNNKTLLIIDSLSVYNVKNFKPDYILLKDSPKLNLIRLIDSIEPQLIIADGSNYKSYLKRWKATCKAKKIPFHQTNEKGAYIFKY